MAAGRRAGRLGWVVRHIARLPAREDRPWRSAEARRDPLRILLAEMMLIRTKHKQAARVYAELTRMSPEDLRDSGRLKDLLAGLGLRHRADGILSALRYLGERKGRVPDDPEELMRIPYVGRYITSAVLCFAFGKPVPPIDSNIIRFTTRFFGLPAPHPSHPTRAHQSLWESACRLAAVRRDPAAFFARLLDFCIDTCSPRPRCETCPLRARCPYPTRRTSGGRPRRSGVRAPGETPPRSGTSTTKRTPRTRSRPETT